MGVKQLAGAIHDTIRASDLPLIYIMLPAFVTMLHSYIKAVNTGLGFFKKANAKNINLTSRGRYRD